MVIIYNNAFLLPFITVKKWLVNSDNKSQLKRGANSQIKPFNSVINIIKISPPIFFTKNPKGVVTHPHQIIKFFMSSTKCKFLYGTS